MKKDRKTAEFIRDSLTNLISAEYQKNAATIDDHTILVNSIHDIYKLYTPDTMEHLQEVLSNIISHKHDMVNYPPKDDEFIVVKSNNEITLLDIINDKLNNKQYEVYILPEVSFVSVPLVEQYKFIFTEKFNDNGFSYFTTYLSIGTHLVEYFKNSGFYDIHQKVIKKCSSIINGNIPSDLIQEKLKKTPLNKNDVIKSILHSMECEKLFKRDHPNDEPWIYDENLILDDDTYYIFRLETNHLSDNEKFTRITTWRNVVYEDFKFIAFQKYPLNPKFDYVKGTL